MDGAGEGNAGSGALTFSIVTPAKAGAHLPQMLTAEPAW
jgi:hypothetical protein